MNTKRIVIEALLIFSAFFLTGFLVQTQTTARPEDMMSVMSFALVMAVPQILLILYILYVQDKRSLEDFGIVRLSIRDPLRILLVYLGMCALILTAASVVQLLPDTARELIGEGYRWSLKDAFQLPLALVFCIVSAYREELFFRSYLLTRLGQLGVAPQFAIAATALLFSAGHLYAGWGGAAGAALQGILLAVVFLKFRSIHTIAIAHGLYNFSIFCITLAIGPILPG